MAARNNPPKKERRIVRQVSIEPPNSLTLRSPPKLDPSSPPPNPPDVTVGSHAFKQRYLYAFATQAEVTNHIRTLTLEEEVVRLPDILTAWRERQAAVQALMAAEADLVDRTQIQPIPPELEPKIAPIIGDALFQKTFSLLPFGFGVVEIDALIAPQRAVNLDYVEQLRTAYRDTTQLPDLMDVCLSPTRTMAPIQHLEVANNTHIFSSPNLDIRFLGAFLKKMSPEDVQFAALGGIPAAAIIAFVGYGGSSVNVLRWQNRVVLNNGFHRVYALRSLGVTHIPVVVQQVNNFQLEFPPIVAGLPREYLAVTPRPVLMKDFLNDDFCLTLKAKQKVKIVTVQTGLGQFDAPA